MKPVKPTRQTMSTTEIKKHLTRTFKATWWGLIDCDRCPKRTGLAPCWTCPRWDSLVLEFRKNDLDGAKTPLPGDEKRARVRAIRDAAAQEGYEIRRKK